MANEQNLVALMSASGRISYNSSTFLRFWSPSFIEDLQMMESRDRIRGKMLIFSNEMRMIFGGNRELFYEITMDILEKDGIIYEEDLFNNVCDGLRDKDIIASRFAIHKFLFEGNHWINDGQWGLTPNSSGPYTLRPKWQQELIYETEEALKIEKDVEAFKNRVKDALSKKDQVFKLEIRIDELIIKCLKEFADEFYANVGLFNNPLKNLVTEAFLGVAIIDSQSQAKALLDKLLKSEHGSVIDSPSKPLKNSYINERLLIKEFNIIESDQNLNVDFHDFGDLPVYLIDPIGTVEVDDGISVERSSDDSQVILHVHVADPSDLVTGDLEREAKFRAETIYLPEIKIPMLPEKITALTTLKSSGIKTLTFSCKIDLNSGELFDHKIRRGIINNLKHLTYEEAEVIKGNHDLDLMKNIREAHLRYRDSRGHLNFSFPRGIAQLDNENEKILVKLDDDLLMKKVVAESMIIAGRIAGEYLKEHKLAGPFRNHTVNFVGNANVQSMNLLEKYEVLKGLQSASVDFIPKRHDSMGLEAYVKVTSPLRRYLDLVTHKILKSEDSVESGYGIEWFKTNLETIHRQEIYNKRLSTGVNRFWVQKFIWQQEKETDFDQFWTLTPLEKLQEGIWMIHVNEVANNFMVSIKTKDNLTLGDSLKCKIISKPHETLLKFEPIK